MKRGFVIKRKSSCYKLVQKGAKLDFKRALIRPQKGTYCKPIRRLLEAKRACFSFDLRENNLQITINRRVTCRIRESW